MPAKMPGLPSRLARPLALASAGIGIGVVALIGLTAWLGERTLALAVVGAISPRVHVLMVIAAGAVLIASVRRRVVAAGAFAVALAFTLVVLWPTSPPPSTGSPRLRIAAWNLAKGTFGLDAIARGVAVLDADVVCLSEAGSYRWLPDADSAELPARLGEPWRIVGDTEVRMLTRLPVISVAELPLPPGPASRPLLLVAVEKDARVVSVACIHLMPKAFAIDDSIDRGDAHDANANEIVAAIHDQGSLLADHVHSLPRPLVLGGDWNASAWGRIVRDVRDRGMVDALGADGPFARTVGSWVNARRIDHLLVSDDLGIVRGEIAEITGSDHLPVFVDVTW